MTDLLICIITLDDLCDLLFRNRLAALKEIKPTLSKLYDALNAEQKKKADDLLTGMSCMM